MERRDLHLGPGAASLILAIVVISLSILGLLSLLQVRSDARLTERSTHLITDQYSASAQAEQDLARLDEAVLQARARSERGEGDFADVLAELLPGEMTLENDLVSWTVEANETTALSCAVRVRNSGGTDRLTWVRHLFESQAGSIEFD